jgi:hypothetical protein
MSADYDDRPIPPHHDHSEHTTRLTWLKAERLGSVIAIGVLLGVAIVLTAISHDALGEAAVFTLGLACGIGGMVMVALAGALSGHLASASAILAIAQNLAALEHRTAQLADQVATLARAEQQQTAAVGHLVKRLADELEPRRSG